MSKNDELMKAIETAEKALEFALIVLGEAREKYHEHQATLK